MRVISTLDWSAVEDGLQMVKAKRMFEETRVLWIHRRQDQRDGDGPAGVKVRAIPRDTFNTEFDKQTATEEVRTSPMICAKAKKISRTQRMNDIVNCARVYLTAKRLLAAEKANALSMDCLGMVAAQARSHASLRRLDAAAGPGHHRRLRGRPVRRDLADDDQLPAGSARVT